MHDDDEERFPRITLLQFLGGVFEPIVKVWLWGPQALIEPDVQTPDKKQQPESQALKADRSSNRTATKPTGARGTPK
jgi:hypothetical protein